MALTETHLTCIHNLIVKINFQYLYILQKHTYCNKKANLLSKKQEKNKHTTINKTMFNLNFLNAHITLTHCALFNSQAFDNIKSKTAKLLFYNYRISVILKLKKKSECMYY